VSGAAATVRAFPRPWRAAAAALTLSRVRRAGCTVLGLQLIAFLAWSTVLYQRFALTWDFSIYQQAWYLIAHGQLDPYSTILQMPFWRNDCEFVIWLLAPLYWLWPHGLVLLWVQDIGVVAAEAVAFTWICDLAGERRRERDAAWLAGTGLVLFAVNPWIWWAVSFDFHAEALAMPFAVLLARDLRRGKGRAWAWVVPILAAGAASATYVVGIGLGGVLGGRRSRLPGAVMALAGLGYSLLIVLVHGDQGGSLAGLYGYLATGAAHQGVPGHRLTFPALAAGIASHPGKVLRTLWARRADIFANLAPPGLLGCGWLAVLPLILVVLLANTLPVGIQFAEPLFQSLPIYLLLPVGTVTVLGWLARRHRWTAMALAGLVVAQALGWAAVWGPRTPGQWLRVPAPAAATLAQAAARIPASAQVIASQGIAGRFSGRAAAAALLEPGPVAVSGDGTWLVIAPQAGVETLPTAVQVALIGELAGRLRATLVTHANGVWVFRWWPPPGVHAIGVPGAVARLPAWAAPLAPGTAGRPVLAGPAGSWRLASTGGKGYVADGLAWQVPPGQYQAQVSLSASGPVNVEVWNDTGHVLLARRSVPGTTGEETVTLPVNATTAYRARVFSGWGPFRAEFAPPPPGERLEVRVWSPGGKTVNVYSAELTPAR
jgi:hypothetical protein